MAVSLTALPAVETQAGDVPAYIPTTVTSICVDICSWTRSFSTGASALPPAVAHIKAIEQVAGTLKREHSAVLQGGSLCPSGSTSTLTRPPASASARWHFHRAFAANTVRADDNG